MHCNDAPYASVCSLTSFIGLATFVSRTKLLSFFHGCSWGMLLWSWWSLMSPGYLPYAEAVINTVSICIYSIKKINSMNLNSSSTRLKLSQTIYYYIDLHRFHELLYELFLDRNYDGCQDCWIHAQHAQVAKFQTHSKSFDLRMYHYIRGESFLKLYVLFNMLAAWWRNFWVNYDGLTATSLESWLIREIIPKWP